MFLPAIFYAVTGVQLRAALKRLGLSQMEASRRMGVTGPTIRRWLAETHRVPPPVAVLVTTWVKHPHVMPPARKGPKGSGDR